MIEFHTNECIDEHKLRYNTKTGGYSNLNSYMNELYAIRKLVFDEAERDRKYMMLLPSFKI